MIIFITGVGRCGTKSLAHTLNFEHEPCGDYPTPEKLRPKMKQKILWGGVSHWWKDNLVAYKQAFPDAYFVHLVREGRENIKSYYKTYFYADIFHKEYHQRSLPIENFDNLSKFEKLCWFWRYWNEEIEKTADERIRLEVIQHLMPQLNIKNPAAKANWSEEREKIFQDICGDLNRKYGYE